MTNTRDADFRRLYERPLNRAHALAEEWDGSTEPITRHEAARLLTAALDTDGWTETDPARLTLVDTSTETTR